ncbi:rhamnogalacturonan lyase family protein [Cytophaga hutchinsonii]|uniref:rhamnogalacturonan lyase family protein n=1 Tax=Cytophaga hutchinsonii TaxID=985 RepID=UPI00091BCDF0|nr:immunoglobulin domain-containing protein [Cytophaga hutchinsonii]SFX50312.1 Por secretion system C-terminal sorting domain-containing protein [Cytophaga hutchinsonii ATCC 33406]
MKEFYILSTLKRIIFIIFLSGITFQHTFAQYQMEQLNRGVVAVSMGGTKVFVSWRWLGTEDNITFNLYRNGTKINSTPLTVSNYTDNAGSTSASYTVKAIVNGVEQAASEAATPWAQKYYTLPLNVPAGGTTPTGEAYTYSPNDCSVGDVDGDGTLEIVVKWDPSNAKDNSQSGYTGNVYIDCYTMKGVFLWRIDLGKNIRAGAHYTQFLVYDFDGDGKAEMACKTADGTKDGKGVVIGSATADYRNSSGYILSGPEFLTVFNGKTGAAMATANYTPGRGTVSSWGDNYGNRVDRFIATVAYLDGQRPSMVFGRGYYTRLVRSAWDFRNGQLTQRWIFDSNASGNGSYAGMGNHQMTVGDVDGDGRQEVCNGSSAVDNDGKGLYSNGLGHGDALHMSDMDPDRPGQEVWQCHEEPKKYGNNGLAFKDAKTGQPIWSLGGGDQGDIGRCMAGDIDPRYKGYEVWGSSGSLYTCKGVAIGTSKPSVNFGVYWDGDLQRELLDGAKLDEWDYVNNRMNRLATLYDASYGGGTPCNTTKATPNISGDLFGDWREEIILHSADNKNLLIYTTTIPSDYKFRTLLHDPQYRVAIAWQNAAYNQPPHLSYYLGTDMATPAKPDITIVGNNTTGCVPAIAVPSTAFCAGGSVLMTATTGTSYKWFNGTSQVGTAATYTATTAGNYTVEVTNASGCKATSIPVTITVNTLPVITPYVKIDANAWTSSSTAAVCEADTVNFGPHPNVASGWSWTGPNNFNSSLRNPVLTAITATQAGTYKATYTDANGCKTTSDFILQVSKPTAAITVSAASFCPGGSAVLTASTGTTYKWFKGTTALGTASTQTVTEAGAYTVEVTNASGCKATSAVTQITLNAAPPAIITASATSFCAGGSAVLTASTGTTYKWFKGTTALGTASTQTVTEAGAYTVEVTNAAGCKATSAPTKITLNAAPPAIITASATSFCAGGSAVLTASTGTTYKWFKGTTALGTASTQTVTEAGAYTVEVTNAAGCKATSAPSTVTLSTPQATPTITATATSFCAGGSAVLTASTGTTYKWFKGTTALGTASTQTVTEAGAYTVEVTNASGCKATSAVTQILTTQPSAWYADTDGDGKGDPAVTMTACTQPAGYVATAGDGCPADAGKIAAGNCGCGNTETSCLDCAGVVNGMAVLDNCNICVGGNTGKSACVTTATVNGSAANIQVIPQPFDGTTTITVYNIGMIQSITIISASGAIVETRQGLSTDEITIGESLAAGLYSVIITTENGMYTTRIVKK